MVRGTSLNTSSRDRPDWVIEGMKKRQTHKKARIGWAGLSGEEAAVSWNRSVFITHTVEQVGGVITHS